MRKLILKLIQKYYLKVDTDIKVGDLVCPRDNESAIFEAVGIYYDKNLKPYLFIQDGQGYIFSKPFIECKRCQNPKVIANANY